MSTSSNRQAERTTLFKVAESAGVSMSTVSLVLAGKAADRRISEDTRARVQKAAEELNYAPNLLTRSLRRGRTHILSFYNAYRHREAADLYMDTLASAIEVAGGNKGYDILVHCNYGRSPREVYQFLNGGLADGLILFAPLASDPLLPMLRKSALPVVLLNGCDTEKVLPSVADDVRTGMRLVARELIARGHRRIAVLVPPYEVLDAEMRLKLLTDSLAAYGVSIPGHWIRPCRNDATDVINFLISEPEPPTAIFCWHDRLAYGVLETCDRMGIAVPEKLSIVGYDGMYWPSATRHVAASVVVDLGSLARSAVELLDLYVNGYQGPLREDAFPVTFSAGTSLGSQMTLATEQSL